MSSIIISGDTSGTATIQAPSVAGTPTLTLPTTSGTILTTGSTTGANGSAISTGTVAEAYGGTGTTTGYYGFKNRIFNGNFDIWQYGTSSSSSGYTTADRWKLTVVGTTTFSQETSVIPSNSRYALKWTTGASSSYGQIRQFIETANIVPMQGKTITCSALVRCNATYSGNAQFEIGYATTSDSSGASYTTISGTITGTVTSSGYTQITWVGTVPSNAVGLYIGIVPTVVQASGAILYISQVQCELGPTATSFEYRPYGTELQLCQRYYYQLGGLGSNQGIFFNGGTVPSSSSGCPVVVSCPVTFRTSPNFATNLADANYNSGTLSGSQWQFQQLSNGTVSKSGSAFGIFGQTANGNIQAIQFFYATLSGVPNCLVLGPTAYVSYSAEL